MRLTAVVTRANPGRYAALNPETGTTAQGDSIEEAVTRLRKATIFFLEEFPLDTRGMTLITTFDIPAGKPEGETTERFVH